MTRPEHAAHDPDRSVPFSTEGGVPPSDLVEFGTEIRYRSALFGYNPVQSGTIGYRLVEIGYSLPDLYRKPSSLCTGALSKDLFQGMMASANFLM